MLGWRVAAHVCLLSCLLGALVACQTPARDGAGSKDAAAPTPGWVEFVVRDTAIPADIRVRNVARAPSCQLKVLLDRKSVISTTLHPTGDAPPYTLAFSFRIRAVAGGYTATFRYSGCDDGPDQRDEVVAKAPLLVLPDGVTQVLFDGALVSTRPPTMLSGPAAWNP
jgi:hypothetical protein